MPSFELHGHDVNRLEEESEQYNQGNNNRTIVSPLYQVALIALNSMFLCSLFYYRANTFKAKDPAIPYHAIDPQSFRRFGGFANNIEVGLYISEFEEFNIIKNNFIFSGQIWFSFSPGTISIDTLQKFSFMRGDILYKSLPISYLIDDRIVVQYAVKVQLKNSLDLSDFPLDDHVLCIQLQHLYITPNELFFTTSLPNFIHASPIVFGWNIVDKEVKTGYIELNLNQMDNA